MGKTYSRVQRGQVYWFNPMKAYGETLDKYTAFNGREYPTHVQNFNRPWLVTSNDEGNGSSPTCNIVPITLEDKTRIPVHVNFTYEGKTQTILVEQPRTVDCLALQEYMYTLSDEVMEKVERAIAIQHDIRPQVTYMDLTLDNTLQHLEKVIGQIISSKVDAIKAQLQQEYTPKKIPVSQVEDTALNLGQMIEDLVSEQLKPEIKPVETVEEKVTEVTEEVKETPISVPAMKSKPARKKPGRPKKAPSIQNTQGAQAKYSGMNTIEKFNAKYRNPELNSHPQKSAEKPHTTRKQSKTGRNSWTTESRLEFIHDCEKMSPQEVMKKWKLGSISSVFQTKYNCKNKLIMSGVIKEQ